mmetsp:Transcript_65514/g.153284  ORF Transcript_65514/g.153284 Transcript_65514/m.153284 type:complete len:227 (+) Transcript_65514:161-841(+)
MRDILQPSLRSEGRCDCGCGYAAELLELARLPELEANPEYILHVSASVGDASWSSCRQIRSPMESLWGGTHRRICHCSCLPMGIQARRSLFQIRRLWLRSRGTWWLCSGQCADFPSDINEQVDWHHWLWHHWGGCGQTSICIRYACAGITTPRSFFVLVDRRQRQSLSRVRFHCSDCSRFCRGSDQQDGIGTDEAWCSADPGVCKSRGFRCAVPCFAHGLDRWGRP